MCYLGKDLHNRHSSSKEENYEKMHKIVHEMNSKDVNEI
jgi:exonuclease VII small subunit